MVSFSGGSWHQTHAATIGVSARILKIKELIDKEYITGNLLGAWTSFYEELSGVLKPYKDWIDVYNFEFSVGY
jgi:hypothetical protein